MKKDPKVFAAAMRNNEINVLMSQTFVKTIDAKLKPVKRSAKKM